MSIPRLSAIALKRLIQEDAVGQLLRREGVMRRLGSENGILMLDWVDAVPRLLNDPTQLESLEQEALQLIARGIRHIVWAGMGGSVVAVQVLCALGFEEDRVRIHPLDSTDPRALSNLLTQLAASKGLALPAPDEEDDETCYRELLADVAMIGVAMGKTSEEPISHLQWFASLLERARLTAAEHMLVMSIPGSYLQMYADSRNIPSMPLQLDGGMGTPGRMSAPATRVFLLPVAIWLAARQVATGTLCKVLAAAWAAYDLDGAAAHPESHPFVRLAAALAGVATNGACALWLDPPVELEALRWWTEQLFEESLGKDGKGIIVFANQVLVPRPTPAVDARDRPLTGLHMRISAQAVGPDSILEAADANAGMFALHQSLLFSAAPADRLAGLAAMFLGLQLTTALYGYLYDIPFAGQPAVEWYKSRARTLRATGDPVRLALDATSVVTDGRLRVLPPPSQPAAATGPATPVETVAAALASPPTYLDFTVNGEISEEGRSALEAQLRHLGNDVLGVPVKLRRAPASYHSTEQSEMDGPAGLVSLRALADQIDMSLLGGYDAAFLRAQAVGTWMAMNENGRACFLLLYDGTEDELVPALCRFLAAVAEQLGWRDDGGEA